MKEKKIITDEDVFEEVKRIHKEVLPSFDNVEACWNKILIKIIRPDAKELSNGGLLLNDTVNSTQKLSQGRRYMETYPYQAVVLSVGQTYSSEGFIVNGTAVKRGDHILTKDIDPYDLTRNALIINKHLVAYCYTGDIHCILKTKIIQGPAKKKNVTFPEREIKNK